MTSRPNDCDRKRLRLSLEGRLSAVEQAELADHLETCLECQRQLEKLAAASGYWGDAVLLRGEAAGGWFAHGRRRWRGQPLGPRVRMSLTTWTAACVSFSNRPIPLIPRPSVAWDRMRSLRSWAGVGWASCSRLATPGSTVRWRSRCSRPPWRMAPTPGDGLPARPGQSPRLDMNISWRFMRSMNFAGLPYLVMQYIPGRSLQERLDASGPLEVREILRIGTQAARALAAAHAQGVVHRDIKPANILLENCVERVKLTDFGLARAIDDASLTQSGVIAGTPQYMAPEQARGEPVDARADLFALGAALYAMAAGPVAVSG